jgi:hypothetical protein
MTEAKRPNETSAPIRATRRHIPDDGVLHKFGLIRNIQLFMVCCTALPASVSGFVATDYELLTSKIVVP